jgi:carbon starvation protein CstA
LEQRSIRKRLYVCVPLFAAVIALLVWQVSDANGFKTIWNWFGWSNQTLSVFMLWAITVYLVQQKKPYIITLVPALFMTVVCTSYILVAPEGFSLPLRVGLSCGVALMVLLAVLFAWKKKSLTPEE